MHIDSDPNNQLIRKIDVIKHIIIDKALLFGLTLGTIAYLVSIYNSFPGGFHISDITDLISIILLLIIYLVRKRISLKWKVNALLLILFTIIYMDVLKGAILAINPILLVLIAFIAFLHYNQRTTIFIFAIGIVGYIFLGFLYSKGVFIPVIDTATYGNRVDHWIIKSLIISVTTIPIIYYNASFSKIVQSLLTDLRKNNRELVEREANLKSIFESTNHMIGLFDRDLNLVEFNRSLVHYAKHTDNLDLYKGMPILDLISRPQAQLFRGFLNRALEGSKFSELVEYPVDDDIIFFLLSYNPNR